MLAYILRRLALAVLLVWLISLVTFVLTQLTLGTRIPAPQFQTQRSVRADLVCRRLHIEGLVDDRCQEYAPWVRYPHYAAGLLRGDLGDSFTFHEPVRDVLALRIPNTLLLTGTAMLLALAGGFLLGFHSASRPGGAGDAVARVSAYLGFSVPSFVVGIMLLLLAVWLNRSPLHIHLPIFGMHSSDDDSVEDLALHMLLPVTALALVQLAYYTRFVRSGILDVLPLDYIRTARAKGLSEGVVLSKHALRNALPPLITVVSLSIPGLISSAIIIEAIFSWPGIGQVLVRAASTSDQPLVLGVILVVAIATVLVNLVADVAMAVADPRIRY